MADDTDVYRLDTTGVDWGNALRTWRWLLPPRFSVLYVNYFADLTLLFEDGSVHWLDVWNGCLMRLGDNRDAAAEWILNEDNARVVLVLPVVNLLRRKGVLLQPGQCYGFKVPLVSGGEQKLANIGPMPLVEYLIAQGEVHERHQVQPLGGGK